MFENNQKKYDKIKAAVQNHWDLSDEEFSQTQGDLEEIVHTVSHKYHEPESEVRNRLQAYILNDEEDKTPLDTPPDVVKEWQAREDQHPDQ